MYFRKSLSGTWSQKRRDMVWGPSATKKAVPVLGAVRDPPLWSKGLRREWQRGLCFRMAGSVPFANSQYASGPCLLCFLLLDFQISNLPTLPPKTYKEKLGGGGCKMVYWKSYSEWSCINKPDKKTPPSTWWKINPTEPSASWLSH